jgi:hypothetical protein
VRWKEGVLGGWKEDFTVDENLCSAEEKNAIGRRWVGVGVGAEGDLQETGAVSRFSTIFEVFSLANLKLEKSQSRLTTSHQPTPLPSPPLTNFIVGTAATFVAFEALFSGKLMILV